MSFVPGDAPSLTRRLDGGYDGKVAIWWSEKDGHGNAIRLWRFGITGGGQFDLLVEEELVHSGVEPLRWIGG